MSIRLGAGIAQQVAAALRDQGEAFSAVGAMQDCQQFAIELKILGARRRGGLELARYYVELGLDSDAPIQASNRVHSTTPSAA